MRKKKNPNELNEIIGEMRSLDPYFDQYLINTLKLLIKLIKRVEFNKLVKNRIKL